MENIVIIDYGSGNLHSAENVVRKVIRDHALSATVRVSADPAEVGTAHRLILPGVGAFGACRAGLDGIAGLVDVLSDIVLVAKRPFLGICVGMQLLADRGAEFGGADGLGWIGGDVVPLAPTAPDLKVPHMGWNTVSDSAHPVLPASGDAYFVHSYHLTGCLTDRIVARCDYGGPVTAAVARDNIIGVQFHPEKSQAYGQALLRNFLTWEPVI